MDSVISLGSHSEMFIHVEWPSEMTCDVGPMIQIKISVPRNVAANFLAESNETFRRGDGDVRIKTNTEVVSKSGGNAKADITAVAKEGDARFPMNLIVTINGDVTKIEGQKKNNNKVSGTVSIPAR